MSSRELYGVVLSCEETRRSFKSEAQARLWTKLHIKKCAKCVGSTITEHRQERAYITDKEYAMNISSPQVRMNKILSSYICPIVTA